jgi:hypothetical protein
VNLGELVLDHGQAKLKATTELQTFGMMVTAEPYFAVTQPSDVVVLENARRADSTAREEEIDFSYQLLAPGAYSSTNERIKDAIFGIDRNTPLELFEARNAVRIARLASADLYAGPVLAKAEQSLAQAESAYRQKQNRSYDLLEFKCKSWTVVANGVACKLTDFDSFVPTIMSIGALHQYIRKTGKMTVGNCLSIGQFE